MLISLNPISFMTFEVRKWTMLFINTHLQIHLPTGNFLFFFAMLAKWCRFQVFILIPHCTRCNTMYTSICIEEWVFMMQKCDLIQNCWRSSSLYNLKRWKMNNYIIAYIHKFIRPSPRFETRIMLSRLLRSSTIPALYRSNWTEPNFRMSMLMGGNVFSVSVLSSSATRTKPLCRSLNIRRF